ncbi:galactofuranose ABC transporter, permease protein YjfF [Motilibacter deserti]|uniref:Sugar ABC transporter permease YjfF n=1 Tax=Motilibacter deserti TaxID=2714956 RepID=A0ABX0GUC5_9ACTN|nr:galactofuranose ABC transporter, permease protein YjfF [Motilibacter deserti]NHC14503.1 sugar ABC transporter permease YjfF [Motilibacter deserti]
MSTAVLDKRPTGLPRVSQRYFPVLATLLLLVLMYLFGTFQYEGFASGQGVANLFIDNSYLIVVAVGMTFVILTGGIDLSVGAVVGLSTMVASTLLEDRGWSALLVIPVVLLIGCTLGGLMGAVIHYYEIQPFIVTLAGMFLARGLCYVISTDSQSITDGLYSDIALKTIPLGGGVVITYSVIVALAAVLVAYMVLHYTRLGRNVYAMGGSKQSAMLMGLPVARTTIAVYTISGFCAALGGILFSFYALSGSPNTAIGLELDAIAAVVIGGTLLIGGSGFVLGSVIGVLVLGLIQTIITFANLESYFTRITIGLLLFAFILLQRLVFARRSPGS